MIESGSPGLVSYPMVMGGVRMVFSGLRLCLWVALAVAWWFWFDWLEPGIVQALVVPLCILVVLLLWQSVFTTRSWRRDHFRQRLLAVAVCVAAALTVVFAVTRGLVE